MYPYVVPAGYLQGQAESSDWILPLGHDLHVMLWQDLGNSACNVLPQQLKEAGLDSAAAHELALGNLERFARSGGIRISVGKSADGTPFMGWLGHWLAASCIRLPGLFDFASRHLGVNDLFVSIPQREAMIIFPGRDRASRDEMRALIRKNEGDARKLITWELFTLVRDGISPFMERSTGS